MRKLLIIMTCCLCLSGPALAGKRLKPEKEYQTDWCSDRGKMEFVLPDKTRCDCLTATHAVEVDFGNKWAEAIGQSLYYAFKTGKRAGILLILEKPSDQRYWLRLNSTIEHYNLPIDTWAVGAGAIR